MEDFAKVFKEEFKNLKIESKQYATYFEEDLVLNVHYKELYFVTGLEGNPELQFSFKTKEESEKFASILRKNIFIFSDFLAIKYEDKIEILLSSLSFRQPLKDLEKNENDNYKIIEVDLNYYRNELNISLELGSNNKILSDFASFIRGANRYLVRKNYILTISNYLRPTSEGIVNDTRNIINSVLFDIEYSYDIPLETLNIEGIIRRTVKRKKRAFELPKGKIDLVYKKYIPELIQYFHIAEKVDFIPFKYICYYHIIEYFSDKSAYYLVSNEVKKILLKPDFHLRTEHYVSTVINFFKKENDKFTSDKTKIERVFKQFVIREELKESLNDIDFLSYFSKEITFECSKPLKLPAINFENDGNFYGELTKRIYSTRCSIVHSNPDFDESKAVPFSPTPSNIEKLRSEVELIMAIARIIIINSIE